MDAHITHIEQYKMLREELMHHMREISRLELYGAIAVGATYTWLLLHKSDITARAVWFIPPCIVILCSLRCLAHTLHIKSIARYLKLLEELAFKDEQVVPGWERYASIRAHKWITASEVLTSVVMWIITFGVTIIASYFFSK
ncbi:hypothetical protein DB347_09515 [Opitutaceae bacterium EW11]|nr:hypothetical protein DB347_09515 [Opitutaceae bacterium EW11]